MFSLAPFEFDFCLIFQRVWIDCKPLELVDDLLLFFVHGFRKKTFNSSNFLHNNLIYSFVDAYSSFFFIFSGISLLSYFIILCDLLDSHPLI